MLGKKKTELIERIDVVRDIMLRYGHEFIDLPPDHWHNNQKQLYDLAVDIESQVKKEVVAVLNQPIKRKARRTSPKRKSFV